MYTHIYIYIYIYHYMSISLSTIPFIWRHPLGKRDRNHRTILGHPASARQSAWNSRHRVARAAPKPPGSEHGGIYGKIVLLMEIYRETPPGIYANIWAPPFYNGTPAGYVTLSSRKWSISSKIVLFNGNMIINHWI